MLYVACVSLDKEFLVFFCSEISPILREHVAMAHASDNRNALDTAVNIVRRVLLQEFRDARARAGLPPLRKEDEPFYDLYVGEKIVSVVMSTPDYPIQFKRHHLLTL